VAREENRWGKKQGDRRKNGRFGGIRQKTLERG